LRVSHRGTLPDETVRLTIVHKGQLGAGLGQDREPLLDNEAKPALRTTEMGKAAYPLTAEQGDALRRIPAQVLHAHHVEIQHAGRMNVLADDIETQPHTIVRRVDKLVSKLDLERARLLAALESICNPEKLLHFTIVSAWDTKAGHRDAFDPLDDLAGGPLEPKHLIEIARMAANVPAQTTQLGSQIDVDETVAARGDTAIGLTCDDRAGRTQPRPLWALLARQHVLHQEFGRHDPNNPK
jgi:hypothetical protein